jgi:hypothetical protein
MLLFFVAMLLLVCVVLNRMTSMPWFVCGPRCVCDGNDEIAGRRGSAVWAPYHELERVGLVRRPSARDDRERGVTTIEVLVCVAILAIIAIAGAMYNRSTALASSRVSSDQSLAAFARDVHEMAGGSGGATLVVTPAGSGSLLQLYGGWTTTGSPAQQTTLPYEVGMEVNNGGAVTEDTSFQVYIRRDGSWKFNGTHAGAVDCSTSTFNMGPYDGTAVGKYGNAMITCAQFAMPSPTAPPTTSP